MHTKIYQYIRRWCLRFLQNVLNFGYGSHCWYFWDVGQNAKMFEEAIQKSSFTKNQNVISKINGFINLFKNSDKIIGDLGYRKVYGIRDIKLG